MHRGFVIPALAALSWSAPAHAQFHHHEHDTGPRFGPRFERPLPPSRNNSVAPLGEGVASRHRPVDPVRSSAKTDGPVCDSPARDPDAIILACGRIIARGQIKGGYSLPAAYTHRGQAFVSKADFDHAIADFSDAIRLQPESPSTFVMRGTAREKSGAAEVALNDFRQAAKLDGGNQEALAGIKRIGTRSLVPVAATEPASSSAPAAPAAVAVVAGAVAAGTVAVANATSPPVATGTVAAGTVAAGSTPVLAPPPAASTSPGGRIALVIGNGAYVNANALPNPPNDARAIAAVLREIGFDVIEGVNLSRSDMESQFRDFLRKATTARVALLFYAGHGMQVDGKNYLVPVDAKLAEATDLPFETIEIDKLLEALGDPGHTNIILLDACRDNPLARSFARRLPAARSAAVTSGLAAYSAVGTGTLIAYATAPGQTAQDGQGADSPFTTSLLHNLRTPGLEIRQVLTRVRAEVAAATGNKQIPWDNSSLMGDVVLVAGQP